MQGAPSIAATGDAVREFGLITRGGFNSNDGTLPPAGSGQPARALVLVGVAGSGFWPVFRASPEYSDQQNDPLDRWSRRIGNSIANWLDASCVFPFDGPPYQPFLTWAQRAEALHRSRLGMMMHPEYGLWHAYRFALLFAVPLSDMPAAVIRPDICAACEAQPCLKACPVDAFSESGYDVAACYRHLRDNPMAECHTDGCIARRACPQATAYRYEAEHAAFHMTAFARAHAKRFNDN